MAWHYEKSGITILLDIFRNLLIVVATGFVVFSIWKWNWIVALIAALPVYIVMLNVCGFLTLPLYALTPENRVKATALTAFKKDFKKGKAETDDTGERPR